MATVGIDEKKTEVAKMNTVRRAARMWTLDRIRNDIIMEWIGLQDAILKCIEERKFT